MRLDWFTLSNPVAVWWSFLLLVSAVNIALLLALAARFRNSAGRGGRAARTGAFAIEPLLLLAAVYVLGCAFRSILPRADVQRICLFDTVLSSVIVGRSVATVAEICFVAQWAIVLRVLADAVHAGRARKIAAVVVPLIVLAEGCSWYAVITTDYLGNVLENSLWTLAFLLIGAALLQLFGKFHGFVQAAIAAAAAGIAGYVVFMCTVDVPMYFLRWQAELASGHPLLGLAAGLHDVATRWIVTHDFARWKHEIAWMTLYFSAAVWTSLLLAGFALVRHRLPLYRTSATLAPLHPTLAAIAHPSPPLS
jgi:hypothetical protein